MIDYNGQIHVHSSLLRVVLHDRTIEFLMIIWTTCRRYDDRSGAAAQSPTA